EQRRTCALCRRHGYCRMKLGGGRANAGRPPLSSQGNFVMKILARIIEGTITATQEHVWVVVVSAAAGKNVEVGFRLRKDAVAYRNALLALRRESPNAMERHLEDVRREQRSHAVITYG